MPIILNMNVNEYFFATNENEQKKYLRKLLNHKYPNHNLLDWKVEGRYKSFKSIIRWNNTDKIIYVPSHIESYILANKYYKCIEINTSGLVHF